MLVVGGTGLLGRPVVLQLLKQDFVVCVFSRSEESVRKALGGARVEIALGRVEDEEALRNAMKGADFVHVSLMGGPSEESLDVVEHLGTARVAKVAAECDVKRLSYLSGAPVGAPEEVRNRDAGTRAKFNAENAIRASGVPFTIFRATWMIDALALFIRGSPLMLGPQVDPLHWISCWEFAEKVVASYSIEKSANKTLVLFGPEAISKPDALKRFVAAREQKAVSEVALTTLPLWLMKGLSFVAFGTRI